MKYEAYKDNVFVLVEKHQRKTAGGISLPDSVASSEFGPGIITGRVLKAGPGGFGKKRIGDDDVGGLRFFGVDVTQGERVLFGKLDGEVCIVGQDIKAASAPQFEPGTEIRILRNDELIGAIDD